MDNETMDGLSMDIERVELDKLRSLFPQCFVDGQLSVTKLMEACGEFETVDENDREKYEFRWKGKQEAQQMAGKRSAGALRPCPEESVNWAETQNLYIEGDNLEVLKLLQRTYFRKVKMIYIDPPYNTGQDFVYSDDFTDPLARYREITQQTTKSNSETMGRFHTAWLNMMYPRLRLAANLLRDDGIMFISIDDNEVHNLRKICDEIFGEENFICQFVWKRRSGANDAKNNASLDHEYILAYGRLFAFSLKGVVKTFDNYSNPDNDPRGEWARDNLTCGKTASQRPNLFYPITDPKTGIEYQCNPDHVWRFEKSKMEVLIQENKVIFPPDGNGNPAYKRHRAEVRSDTKPFGSMIDTRLNSVATKELRDIFQGQVFDYPKTTDLLKQLVDQATTPTDSDIVVDFFSGSATTAHAVMQLNAEDGGNRRFIMIQLPEVTGDNSEAHKAGYKTICEIGKERIRRAGVKIIADRGEQISIDGVEASPLDVGFKVFKLDSSNLKLWDDSPISGEDALYQLEIRLKEMLDIIKPDRSELDIVYEVMLKLGQELTKPIIPLDINDKTVYGVGTGNGDEVKFIICFAPNVTPEDADAMAEYAPGRIIFANACFNNSEGKTNVKLTLKDKGITMKAL